jgi:AcrR family transcriptional regulator
MRKPRPDLGEQRRAQIVEAAVAIIAEQGLDKLSLSAIEVRTEMSRGHLYHYFASKEDILLAVFDRMLEMMRARAHAEGEGPPFCAAAGWERLRLFLGWFLLHPPADCGFHALQHTFLSQIGHRADFRQRLADLYEEWRKHMAADVSVELEKQPSRSSVSARTVASLIQAILHGLSMQRAADPDAFDRREMLELCMNLLGSYLQPNMPTVPGVVQDEPDLPWNAPAPPAREERP